MTTHDMSDGRIAQLERYLLSRVFLADLLWYLLGTFVAITTLLGVFFSLGLLIPIKSTALSVGACVVVCYVICYFWWGGQTNRFFAIFGLHCTKRVFRFGPFSASCFYRDSAPVGKGAPVAAISQVLHLAFWLLMIGIVVHVTHLYWHAKLDNLAHDMGSRGLPVSLVKLQDAPEESYALPAAEKVLASIHAAGAISSAKARSVWGQKWDRPTFLSYRAEAMRTEPFFLKGLMPILAESSRLMKIDYVRASQDPFALEEPSDKFNRWLFSQWRVCAMSRAFEGNTARAWQHIRAMQRASALLSRHPTLYAKAMSLDALECVVSAGISVMATQPKSVLPGDIAKALRTTASEFLMASGLKTELARWFDVRDSCERGTGKRTYWSIEVVPSAVRWGMARTGIWDLNALMLCSGLSRLATTAQESELRLSANRYRDELRALPAWPYGFAKLAGNETMWEGFDQEWELRNWIRLTLLTSAVISFHNRYSRYPFALRMLGKEFVEPADMQDVYTGQEFHYTLSPDGKGFSLCSLGPKGNYRDSQGNDFCVRQHL
jgi:hypothetical protein